MNYKKFKKKKEKSIKELEEGIFNKYFDVKPFGEILFDMAQEFDMTKQEQDMLREDSLRQDSLMDEFEKGVKYIYGNYDYNHPEVQKKVYEYKKTINDMITYDKKYLDKFIELFINESIKPNKRFNEAYKQDPLLVREFLKRITINPERDKREILQELKDERREDSINGLRDFVKKNDLDENEIEKIIEFEVKENSHNPAYKKIYKKEPKLLEDFLHRCFTRLFKSEKSMDEIEKEIRAEIEKELS